MRTIGPGRLALVRPGSGAGLVVCHPARAGSESEMGASTTNTYCRVSEKQTRTRGVG